MNIYTWTGIMLIVFFTVSPLLKKEYRTKVEIIKVAISMLVIFVVVLCITIFNMNFTLAIILLVVWFILLDKKTYTKKGFIIHLSILLFIGGAIYALMRDNPDYIWKHLKKNPQTTSLYVAQNGEELITYQSDVVRPLASVVKIVIALEYAMQVEEGKVNKNTVVEVEDLDVFYFKGTDGGAHEAWLSNLDPNKEVILHEVAKGMILYSSNANTDYLINLLGVDAINNRLIDLGITQHEDVYPIVGALLIPSYIKKEQTEKELMS